MTYVAVLTAHSWLRWVALAIGVAVVTSALSDSSGLADRPRGARWDAWWMAAIDLQVLLGLVLYFGFSPLTREGLTNLGAAMRTPAIRFWALDHAAFMTAAFVLVRIGRVCSTAAPTATARRTRRLVCFGLAVLMLVAGTPWPGTAHERPLFRLLVRL